MKRVLVVVTAVLAAAITLTMSFAEHHDTREDDVAFIKEAYAAANRGWQTGDATLISMYDHPDYSAFTPDGGLLVEEYDKEALQRDIDNGMKMEGKDRHLQIAFYGNTAVTTSYFIGSVTSPGADESIPVSLRMTNVWSKDTGTWKWVHTHASPLQVGIGTSMPAILE